MAKTSGFVGFAPGATEFFRDLAENNDRTWFLAHKSEYEARIVVPLEALLAGLIAALDERGLPLTGDPKKSIFRIHRDVRFSADKRPYKTSAGAALTRGGGKGKSGVLYVHLAADECFAAAGYYNPDRDALGALREAIYTEPDRFAALCEALAGSGLALDAADRLTRMPRGFEAAADTLTAPALRLKSFVVRRAISHSQLSSPKLLADIVAFAEDAAPLLEFGHAALSVLDPTALTRRM